MLTIGTNYHKMHAQKFLNCSQYLHHTKTNIDLKIIKDNNSTVSYMLKNMSNDITPKIKI